MIWDTHSDEDLGDSRWFVGQNVYKVFNRLTEHLAEGIQPDFLEPIETILDGRSSEGMSLDEHKFSKRTYPLRRGLRLLTSRR
jgi:hypothetical protein